MWTGVIVENSLIDTSILSELDILKSWSDGDWKLHEVRCDAETIEKISHYLSTGPWYIHFWAENKEDVIVVFKDNLFKIKLSDKDTWADAVGYGLSLSIPLEQLDFLIDQTEGV